MSNPLLGKRISLISKKNIRYEGILYSINESNATVALQNVRSFGTEGREGIAVVEADTQIHPFLIFRGEDIKDLHVHDDNESGGEAKEAATATQSQPAVTPQPAVTQQPAPAPKQPAPKQPAPPANTTQPKPQQSKPTQQQKPAQQQQSKPPNSSRRKKNDVGTGASLLHRSARGQVTQQQPTTTDFDLYKTLDDDQDQEEDVGDSAPPNYSKDDFFDSISCDALDKQKGLDNRLKSHQERRLNTETFGAVALSNNNNRRRRNNNSRGGRGRGRGGRGGRGGKAPEAATS